MNTSTDLIRAILALKEGDIQFVKGVSATGGQTYLRFNDASFKGSGDTTDRVVRSGILWGKAMALVQQARANGVQVLASTYFTSNQKETLGQKQPGMSISVQTGTGTTTSTPAHVPTMSERLESAYSTLVSAGVDCSAVETAASTKPAAMQEAYLVREFEALVKALPPTETRTEQKPTGEDLPF